MNFLRRTPVLGLGAFCAAATLLTACSGGSSGGGPSGDGSSSATTGGSTATATVTATATDPTGSTPAGATPPGTPAQSSTGGTAPSTCTESQLRASLDPRPYTGTADAGKRIAYVIDFRNTSSAACTISGYPGVALVDSSGEQAKQATRTIRGAKLGLPVGQNTVPRVTLQPGAYASAGVEGVNQQEQGAAQAGCQQRYPRILVTPPNTTTPVPFTLAWPYCYSVTVHPTNVEKNPPN